MPQNYSAKIKEHYQHPRNAGKLKPYTHSAEGLNSACGDEIKIYLHIQKRKIQGISYEARGCMITVAAASLLSEKIKEQDVTKVANLKESEIIKLLGIPISPARRPCATLALETLKKALKD